MQGMHTGLVRRIAVTALATALLLAATLVSATAAGAAASADLSIRQSVARNSAPNQLVITEHVSNAGPSSAAHIGLVVLVRTVGTTLSTTASQGQVCQLQTPPPGWQALYSCQDLTRIASGATWTPRFTMTGEAGGAVTLRVSVGAFTADPDGTNNVSTLKTGFGAADLAVSESAGPTSFPLMDSSSVVIRNRGPEAATSLDVEIDLAGAGQGGWSTGQAGASCTPVNPAPTGYDLAESCTLDTLAPGSTWTISGTFQGGVGSSLKQDASVSTASFDPNLANNSATVTAPFS